MTVEERAQLREKALKATEGPEAAGEYWDATANPAVVLGLLEELEGLEAERQEILDGMRMWLDYVHGRNYKDKQRLFTSEDVGAVVAKLQTLLEREAAEDPS